MYSQAGPWLSPDYLVIQRSLLILTVRFMHDLSGHRSYYFASYAPRARSSAAAASRQSSGRSSLSLPTRCICRDIGSCIDITEEFTIYDAARIDSITDLDSVADEIHCLHLHWTECGTKLIAYKLATVLSRHSRLPHRRGQPLRRGHEVLGHDRGPVLGPPGAVPESLRSRAD